MMNKVQVYGIEVLAKLHVAKFDRPGSIVEEYRQFTHDVDHVTIQIRLRSALIDRQGSVGLDDITKAKIQIGVQSEEYVEFDFNGLRDQPPRVERRISVSGSSISSFCRR